MATKKQARARAQEARRRAAELRREEQARARRRRVVISTATAVVLAGAAVGIFFAATSGGGIKLDAVKKYKGLSRLHVTGHVKYKQTPPAGGEHNAVWLNCGIYDSPVPNENAVHDLEHGAVWITYRPGLDAASVQQLKDLVKSKTRGYLDLSPYPGLPAPVVASAWGVQERLRGASDPELPKFIDNYQLGPTAPERGSPCTGGTGTPSG
jgi:hypothetical protein